MIPLIVAFSGVEAYILSAGREVIMKILA